MPSSGLTRLFSPRTVAVIGGRVAESVCTELDKLGFAGEVWPVNTNRPQMAGRDCHASVSRLPAAPDCAYIAVPRDATVATVAELAAMGCGGAICHASGFAEVGDEGRRWTEKLIAAAGDMPLIGPNCWGVLNLFDRIALWPDFHGAVPVERGVAIVNQSGNMAINYTMQQRGLPLGMLVTLGNQVMFDANDCLEAFLEDDRITAIGLHVEGIGDVERFSRLAIRAHDLGKPIVALKTGASAKAARAAVSHTATLVGADGLYDALFRRFGIARAHSVPAFLETLKLLSVTGPLSGNRIASLSCSGGEASLIADSAERFDVVFPDLTEAHAAEVRATLNDYVDVTNPLDYHTFIWGQPEALTATFAAMMKGGFDLTILIIDYPRADRSRTGEYDQAVDAWIAASRQTGARTAILATLPECLPEPVAERLVETGIVPFSGMDEALAAIAAAARSGIASGPPLSLPQRTPAPPELQRNLHEAAVKSLLSEAGICIPKGALVRQGDPLPDLGYPVAAKACSTELAHKTEAGAVILDIATPQDATAAVARLSSISTDVLIEEMIGGAVCEFIVGVTHDPRFGLAMTIGAGGILTELLRDSTTLLLPATRADISTALSSLRVNRLLTGYRNKSGDREAIIAAIENIARYAEAHAAWLDELDINPLLVLPPGRGAVAVDALMRVTTQHPNEEQ